MQKFKQVLEINTNIEDTDFRVFLTLLEVGALLC